MSSIELQILPKGIALLCLNRPEVHNALDWEAMQAFAEAVEGLHNVDELAALIVLGTGESFCAGGDLVELDKYGSKADGVRLSSLMGAALARLEALPFPTIAAIEGPALGGGAEITLACDLRIMSETARLGMMHIRLGICPAWGGGQRLLRLVGYPRSLEWITCGRVLTAEEAFEHGLANRIVAAGEARAEALAMASSIAGMSSRAVQAAKRFLRAGIQLPAQEAAQLEHTEFPDLWASPEHLEASAKFVARKKSKSDGKRKRSASSPV